MANNTSENITLTNNTTGQNSSVEAQNITVPANITGKIAVNATVKKCFETKLLRRRAYVKMFVIEYSDNGNLWKQYHEGGLKKVFVLSSTAIQSGRRAALVRSHMSG